MDDSDDEIWEYKSLKKKHKTDEKTSSLITRQNKKLKKATKSLINKSASRGHTQDSIKLESSHFIGNECQSSSYIRPSNSPKEVTVQYQDTSFPSSVDSNRPNANDTENFCPICQAPFSLLRTLSSSSHVVRCLEEPTIPTNECTAGLLCDNKEEMHYKQFKHSALAMARSGQDFTDISGNKSKDISDNDSEDKWRNERLTIKTDIRKKCASNSFNTLTIQQNPMMDVDSQLSLITTQSRDETRPSQEHTRMSQWIGTQSKTVKKGTEPIPDTAILDLDEMRDVSDMLNDALEDEEFLDRRNNSSGGLFNLRCNVNDNVLVKSDNEDERFLFGDDDDDFDVMITQIITPECPSSENLSSSQSAQWKAIFQSQGEIKNGSQNASQKTLNSSQKDESKRKLPSSQNSQGRKTPQKQSSQVLKAKMTPRKKKVNNTNNKKNKSKAALICVEKGQSKNGKPDCKSSSDDKQTVLTSFFSLKTSKTDIKEMKEDSGDDIQAFTDGSSDSSHRSLQKELSINDTNNGNADIKKNSSEISKTTFLKSSSDSFAVRKSLITGVESQVENIDKYEGGGFIPELTGISHESDLTSAVSIDNPTRPSKAPTLLKPDFSVSVLSLNSRTHTVCSDQPVLRKNASEILMASSKRTSTVRRSTDDTAKSFQGKWDKNQSSTVNSASEQNYQKYQQKCPFYKKIPGTSFTVDAFKYGAIPDCKAYFLSHFHYDHYMGLTKKFSQPLYCSQVTANLVQSRIHVDPKFIHPLPLNTAVVIEGTEVTLLEANHCPGSVLLLFKLRSGQAILHTGDFRADPSMELYPVLQNDKIRTLYLDTTYCDPAYTFPPQQDVIDFVVNLVLNARSENPKTLIVCGAYTIGKERVFTAISEALNCRICVTREKKNTLDCLEEPRLQSRLSLKWSDSGLHVLPMAKLKGTNLEEHLSQNAPTYNAVLALEPTGWTFSKKVFSLEHIKPKYNKNGIKIYGVPYSEHSSFMELKHFVQFLKPETIIPTVNNGNPHSRKKMEIIFDSWREEMARGLEQRKGSNPRESKQTNLSAWI
ncbi:hypothetical protein ACJMK2_004920 [Sinanodonta woodiana]|uniref:DNA cross-link repair 1A protein n=1 Tax=Sinanodonta woodiana TaxID=1069815 RepID=A0ABD3VNH6_SINWO